MNRCGVIRTKTDRVLVGKLLRLRLFFFLFFFIQVGCAPYLVVSGGAVNLDKLRKIKAGIAALRGLEFKISVPVEVKDREGMRSYFARELEREYGDEKLKNMAMAYAKLGLFPQGLDLKKALLDFYSAQVAAFYDPEAKKLVLPEDLGGGIFLGTVQFLARRDILGEMVLAHELTHALQDQHFSLADRLRPSSEDDRSLAFHAVIEGDATLSGFAYLFGGLDERSLAEVNRSIQDSMGAARSSLAQVPQAIREDLLFQYYGGVSFVSRVLGQRGWFGVNQLYASPPLSTEQVLHPGKYLDFPDPPTRIDLGNLSALFPAGWTEIENNVLGELMVQVLFKQFLSEENANGAAEGWDGDRFVAFRQGDEIAFVWATVWDSSEDAEEFARGYRELLSKKYGGSKTAVPAAIEQRDRRVLVVEGMEKGRLGENLEKVWQGMELKEESTRINGR